MKPKASLNLVDVSHMPCVCIFKSENRALACFHPAQMGNLLAHVRWRDLREKQKWKTRCSNSDSSPGVRGPSLTLIKTGLICSNLLQPAMTFLPLLPERVHAFFSTGNCIKSDLYSLIRHLIAWGKLSAFTLLQLVMQLKSFTLIIELNQIIYNSQCKLAFDFIVGAKQTTCRAIT